MYNEITSRQPFFNEKGTIANPGWARQMYFDFDPSKMAAPYERLRAWDYYFVGSEKFGIAISTAFVGKLSRVTATILNFAEGWHECKTFATPEDIHQPNDDTGTVYLRSAEAETMYIRKPGKCYMKLDIPCFANGKRLKWDVTLDIPETERAVMATPYTEGEELFFFNEKLNNMRATGDVWYGDEHYTFTPDKDFAVLDFGRGIWPRQNRWYWGSASGVLDGHDFGFNIGYGFGDLTYATENMFFYDGKAHKFDGIFFDIPEFGFTLPWKIYSNDGRFDMVFQPIYDRQTICDIIKGGSLQHQVFGKFTGKAVLDDGTVLDVKEFFGFAEDVINNWDY